MAERHRVHLGVTCSPAGIRQQVTIDGVDITSAVVGVVTETYPCEPPLVRLELAGPVIVSCIDQARVILPDDTRRALLSLGWTPPVDTGEDE